MATVIVDQIDYLEPLLKPVDRVDDEGVYVRQRDCEQLYKLPGSCKDREKLRQLGLNYPIRIVPAPKAAVDGVSADSIRLVGNEVSTTSVFVTAGGFLQTRRWPFIDSHEPKDDVELTLPYRMYLDANVYWLLCTAKHLKENFIASEAAVRLYKIDVGMVTYKVPCRARETKVCFRYYYRKSDLANLRPRHDRSYYDFTSGLKYLPPNFQDYMTREELELYDRLMRSGYRRRYRPGVLTFDGVEVNFHSQEELVRVMYESFKDAVVTCCEESLYNPDFAWADLEMAKEQLYRTAEKPGQFSIEQVLYWDLDILDQFLAEAGYSEFERIKILTKVENFRKSTCRRQV